MKKLLPCFVLALALAACKDAAVSVKPDQMNKGYIHFAASLILEDIIHKGEASMYAQLVPSPVLSPYSMRQANQVIEDFRHDFASAEDRYFHLGRTGAVVRGTVSRIDKDAREVFFVKTDAESRPSFTGTLRISLDREWYNDANMPAGETGAVATFMCAEYRPIHDFRNEKTHNIEVRMIQCKTADDYYGQFQDRIKDRLTAIYAGREPVGPDLAKGLAALYLTGQSVPEDSVCLHGAYLACHENLVDEFARKWGDVKTENIGSMNVDPEKVVTRRYEQVESAPAQRPQHADRSPSGEKIHGQPAGVARQKEAVSRVKIPKTP